MESVTNNLDQVTGIKYNNSMEYEFQYGADGEVTKVQDHVNGLNTLEGSYNETIDKMGAIYFYSYIYVFCYRLSKESFSF